MPTILRRRNPLAAALTSAPLVEAFAHVPRERFLGHGPWTIGSMGAGLGKPAGLQTGNVQHLYHNVPVALDIARGVNNGQPGALALWIDALNLTAGDRVFHLGCGVGYYTAIMAEVVGATGRVTAVEVLPALAMAPHSIRAYVTLSSSMPELLIRIFLGLMPSPRAAAWSSRLLQRRRQLSEMA